MSTIYTNQRVFIIPVADKDAANLVLAADLGPETFSVPLTNNINTTHYGCSFALTNAQLGIMQRIAVEGNNADEYTDPWATVLSNLGLSMVGD